MKKITKKSTALYFVLLFILLVAVVIVYNKKDKDDYERVKVILMEEGELDFDAEVKPEKDVNISSELAKKIIKIYVKEGQKVYPGQVLVQLENSNELANVLSAEANFKSAKAELEKALAGARDEDIESAKKAADAAKAKLESAKLDLRNEIISFSGRIDDYIDIFDEYFTGEDEIETVEFNVSKIDESDARAFEKARKEIEKKRALLKKDAENLIENLRLDNFPQIAINARDLARKMRALALAMQNAADIKKEKYPSRKRLAELAQKMRELRAKLDLDVAVLDKKLSNYETQIPLYKQALANYEKVKAGTRKEDIKALEARVESARAALLAAKSKHNKTFIYSPLSGVVVQKYKNDGEFVSTGEPILKINSAGKYIEILIPENDMSKISIGDKFKVVLDAYKDKPFFAILKFIYPDKIEKGGVVYYKAKLYPEENKTEIENILPGMTGSAYLQVEKTKEVSFPAKFLMKDSSGRQYVLLSIKEDDKEKIIKKYIKAKVESNMARTSDLKEGDTLLLPKK